MSKTTVQGGAAAKKAATTNEKKTNTQLEIKETTKSVAELLEEQKQFFENKNETLRKLKIFEIKESQLQKSLDRINEKAETNSDSLFDEDSSFKLSVVEGYNNDLFVIKKPIIIKSVISAVLVEIKNSRKALEAEFLS